MYTVNQILTAAKIASTAFAKRDVTVRLTAGNQLIGTYGELSKFRAANQADYSGWEAHHIFEALDIDRLGLALFAPPYEQQICVLLPRRAHHRVNSILRHRNETDLTVAVPHLRLDYREAYNDMEDYCGSSKAVIAQELNGIFEAALVNMITLQDRALAKVQGDLQHLLNLLAVEKGLHDKLIRGSSPGVGQTAGTLLSLVNPLTAGIAVVNPANRAVMGAFVNLFNPDVRPGLGIWTKAETHAMAAIQAIRRRDLQNALAELAVSQVHFEKADRAFKSWRDKIDLAGRKAQLAIAAAAAVAAIAATGVFLVEAAGGVGTTAATGGATASGATSALESGGQGARWRIAEDVVEIERGAREVLAATNEAAELEGEAKIEEGSASIVKRRMALRK